MALRDIVVVGASAGGVEALGTLVAGMPGDLEAAVFIVLHISASGPSLLARILQRTALLPVIDPQDGDRIQKGRIYVARSDHHLLLQEDRIRITRGPKENRYRPSVDALFRSAAVAAGTRVIGVILTGSLDDGTAGLWAVKQRGGLAVVQDPEDAAYPSMPLNALRYVTADHVAALAQMAGLLIGLIREPAPESAEAAAGDMQIETAIAREEKALQLGVMKLGSPSPFSCPECHGVLLRLKEGGVPRFRCHTGHAYSVGNLLAAVTSSIEGSLWGSIRALEESVMLIHDFARHLREVGDVKNARVFEEKAEQAQKRADLVRKAAMDHEILGS